MRDRCNRTSFPTESFDRVVRPGMSVREHLHGILATELDMFSLEHLATRALADLLEQSIRRPGEDRRVRVLRRLSDLHRSLRRRRLRGRRPKRAGLFEELRELGAKSRRLVRPERAHE